MYNIHTNRFYENIHNYLTVQAVQLSELAESEEEERKSRHISIVIPYQSLYSATAT